MNPKLPLLPALLALAALAAPLAAQEGVARIQIDGTRFYVDGRLTYETGPEAARGLLMNARMVNAVFDDENPRSRPEGFDADVNTSRFIRSMDEYRARGVLAFTVGLQGGYPGYEGAVNSAFRADGSLKAGYMERVARVIGAADARGMVIILGCYYQRQDQILEGEEAIRDGVRNVAAWLGERGFSNVLLEIANEYHHSGFDHAFLRSVEGQVELIRLARDTNPDLLVSTSGMGDARLADPLAEVGDFALIHGNETPPEAYAGRVAALRRFGKPIVFNEDWCFAGDTRGVSDAVAKARAAFGAGASWGIMNQPRNQSWPFVFGVGRAEDGGNALEDFLAFEALADLVAAGRNPGP